MLPAVAKYLKRSCENQYLSLTLLTEAVHLLDILFRSSQNISKGLAKCSQHFSRLYRRGDAAPATSHAYVGEGALKALGIFHTCTGEGTPQSIFTHTPVLRRKIWRIFRLCEPVFPERLAQEARVWQSRVLSTNKRVTSVCIVSLQKWQCSGFWIKVSEWQYHWIAAASDTTKQLLWERCTEAMLVSCVVKHMFKVVVYQRCLVVSDDAMTSKKATEYHSATKTKIKTPDVRRPEFWRSRHCEPTPSIATSAGSVGVAIQSFVTMRALRYLFSVVTKARLLWIAALLTCTHRYGERLAMTSKNTTLHNGA